MIAVTKPCLLLVLLVLMSHTVSIMGRNYIHVHDNNRQGGIQINLPNTTNNYFNPDEDWRINVDANSDVLVTGYNGRGQSSSGVYGPNFAPPTGHQVPRGDFPVVDIRSSAAQSSASTLLSVGWVACLSAYLLLA
ncbi:hypothetical protein O3G_MSEX008872 [Manduca sexta]|uniref:Uncharacterized protein n=1 Tax=Manduca sexta TaxID=7130 RepID=A0A921ZBF2_MANSE|nr:hypothetical protein O3G_MSEX008872 [Manduca sexta]